jgi:amidophosphoribosyltransferase
MSGIFGIASERDCVEDLFYGVDYHSHLGTKYGGMAVFDRGNIQHDIKRISLHPFRPQFSDFIQGLEGSMGIGVISDDEPQPLQINSHLGDYAIVHVGKLSNLEQLVEKLREENKHFTMGSGEINPTEVIAILINQGRNFLDGIEIMQDSIEGSSSLMLLTKEGIYLARDKYGRTPITTGRREGATAATMESCAFPNLGFEIDSYLGPGEIGIINEQGYDRLKKPEDVLQICSFFYIYFGFPASLYEGINTETTRYKLGEILGSRDNDGDLELDFVAGIPDSGIGSGLGYAAARGLPFKRPFVKYTPTQQRSFMPQEQEVREMVAKYKLIPIRELIEGQRIGSTEDSIVRGTQLQKKIREFFEYGAREVHMRPSCPPLTYTCNFLNFSRSRSVFDLAARKAMRKVEGTDDFDVEPYLDEDSERHERMVDSIRGDLGLTSLRYQRMNDMVSAIGLPKGKLCLGCWRECSSCK